MTKRASKAKPPRRDAGRPRGAPVADVVLQRTLEELARAGVSALSIDRIAAAAEVNKTSIYRRWSSREELVAAALERVLASLRVQQHDTGSLHGDLARLVTSVAAFVERPAGRALVNAVFAQPSETPIASLARGSLRSAAADAPAMVKNAKRRGEWRRGVDPRTVLALLVGAVLHRIAFEGARVDRRFVQDVVGIVSRGVSPQPRAPRASRT